ncbi:hypothetical protein GCM10011357_08910 [Lacimicrobium alkaliphilum]|uniref:SPOR domain-containing protein n=2 Tax=Lacimicrobium alkaliphilum TaxID=1526571 RepID=A0ABQ1R6B3_9ALTE|nr:hypothetical protein GCM10011357_08910 [Lacimicrobium alkaliphilum]
MLSACSSYFQNAENTDDNQSDEAISEQQIQQIVEEWRETRPAIRRLSELESDFMLVLSEIEKLSVIPDAPRDYAVKQELEIVEAEQRQLFSSDDSESADVVDDQPAMGVADQPAMNVVNQPAMDSAPLQQTADNQPSESETLQRQRYAVHIALFLQENTAHVGWKVLNRRYEALFSGLQPLLEKIEHPEQRLYSLRVGPFFEAEQADHFCSVLKRRKYKCKLTAYIGTPIS